MARLGGEHRPVEPIRVGEPAGLMVLDGGNERVGGAHAETETRIGREINRVCGIITGAIRPHPKG